jgi:riboflavin kinase/FMN adenylyltransferase
MKHFSSIEVCSRTIPGPHVLAIGNFDGLHLGHQSILNAALEEARVTGHPAGVFTFQKHPRDVLADRSLVYPISSSWDKCRQLAGMGFDFILNLDADAAFFQQSSRTFVSRVLVDGLRVQELCVGSNFRFGQGAKGDMNVLHALAREFDFRVRDVPLVTSGGAIVSSTRIRSLIGSGQFQEANCLLGRSLFCSGEVQAGKGLGQKLGFPTANVSLMDTLKPSRGVYAVRVFLRDQEWLGVLNCGYAPTVQSGEELTVEIHMPDWTGGELYGETLVFQLLSHLRDERQFKDKEALISQIQTDIHAARQGTAL